MQLMVSDEDFIAALEKNGYRKANGKYITFKRDGSIYAACAVGQALLNLGVESNDILINGPYDIDWQQHSETNKWGFPTSKGLITCPLCGRVSAMTYLYQLAIHLNDHHKLSIKKNGRILRQVIERLNAPAG